MGTTVETGRKGEEMAARYLEINSYLILERNWRCLHREVDIIAMEKSCLVIIEVKTRKGGAFTDPIARMTLKKQAFLISAANAYISENKLEVDVRYDVICVNIDSGRTRLEHIKYAFHPIAG